MKNTILQKMIRILIYLVSCFLILGILFYMINSTVTNYHNEKINSMTHECDRTYGYTYPVKHGSFSKMKFTIFAEREIFVWLWTKNFTGTVEITLKDNSGKTHFNISGTTFDQKKYIRLPVGEYEFFIDFDKVLFGSCIIGLNHSSLFLNTVLALSDHDGDGLPDTEENSYSTNQSSKDTDGDSLTDYHELRKYHTDPLKADSDGDGITDSDWNERREYTYSIRAVLDLRQPFEIEEMTDFYQDAKIIGSPEKDLTRVEVVLYPNARIFINAARYVPVDNEFTQATYTKNYSESMQKQIRSKTKDSETDIQAVLTVLREMKKTKRVDIVDDLGLANDLPVPFYVHRDSQGNIIEEKIPVITGSGLDEIKEQVLFADSMYRNKTHGACTSYSILQGAMLRAAGIPEKTIAVIPLVYFYRTDGTEIVLKDYYKKGYMDLVEGNTIVDHFFNLAYVGNQWVRVDHTIDPAFDILYVKIFDSHDPTDHNMYQHYNYDTWQSRRPYTYLSVIEQDAKHIPSH